MHEGLPVHARAQKGFGILLEALASIKSIKNDEEARSALRAFLSKRRVDRNVGIIPLNIKTGLFLRDLYEYCNLFQKN